MMIKSACHLHSTWSYDGQWSLHKIAKFFSRLGIKVLLMTEHDSGFNESRWLGYRKECKEISNNRLTVVPGMEYSDKTNTIHVLAWGDMPFLGSGTKTGRLLRLISKHKGVSVLAHPGCRDAWKLIDPSWFEYLSGIEVWNRKSDGFSPNQKSVELFLRNKELVPIAGLDFHCWRQLFPLWVNFDMSSPMTEQNVISAIREKRCCSSALAAPLSYFLEGRAAKCARLSERVRKSILQRLRSLSKNSDTVI